MKSLLHNSLSRWLPVMLLTATIVTSPGADTARPNILWITSEDNAAHWLGCYGNAEARTPRLDALAAQGVRFSRAYANAAVCAVARSTILNGAHAVTQGTQHMRSRHPIPAEFKPYVAFLRQQGYYCVNNVKTDYNFKGNDRAIWDDCSNRAHYRNRPEGKPFFAIFNLTITHESQLFPANIRQNREKGVIPAVPRLDPQKLALPPHVPDLPEMRTDFAVYHDLMTALDTQVGRLLDELKEAGLAEDTIVFYYSDHGGATPRGKRYLEDTGTRVPLLIHVPDKWRSLSPFAPGSASDELVSFVDLAPTLLSLVDVKPAAPMQGRAFLGPHRQSPANNAVIFLYADRFDEIYGMRRGLTDGLYKYIRRFTPHLPAAPYSEYSFGQESWLAWQRAARDGRLTGEHARLWQPGQEVEQLFDLERDPWETNNLAADPAHAVRLAAWRERLRQTMLESRDTGLVPEPMFAELLDGSTAHEFVRRSNFDYAGTLELAFQASAQDARHQATLRAALASTNAVQRYWAGHGCVLLGEAARPAVAQLEKVLTDPHAANRITAARALFGLGHQAAAAPVLLQTLDSRNNDYAALLAGNTLMQLDALDLIPPAWVERVRNDPKADEYLQRLANRTNRKQPKTTP
jgi:N-sulfoglucosamine sulfohydrolase